MWVSLDMEVTFQATTSFYGVHVILKTITRTRTLKGGGFGLTEAIGRRKCLLEILVQIKYRRTAG